MKTLITAHKAAEILGISHHIFSVARKGIGAPDPVIPCRVVPSGKNRAAGSTPALYDEEAVRAWGEGKDVRQIALDYRYKLRYGDKPRVRNERNPRGPRSGKPAAPKEKPKSSFNTEMAVAFLSGKFLGPTARDRLEFKKFVARQIGARVTERRRVKSVFNERE